VVGSDNDVGLLSGNFGVTNDNGVGSIDRVAIDVGSTDNLSDINFKSRTGLSPA